MANEKYWKNCNEKMVVCVCVVGPMSHCFALCYYVLDGLKLWALK
jgi:hypothetical protein